MRKHHESPFESNEVYTYDEQAKSWKQTIPPMPTARHSPGVLSLQSALVVAGGAYELTRQPSFTEKFKQLTSVVDVNLQYTEFSDVVEIFKLDTLQWYRAMPLPICCQIISLIDIGNTCYALGGCRTQGGRRCKKEAISFKQAFYVSIDDLLCNTVPANQISKRFQPDWGILCNTPIYGTFAAALAGKLLAIGQSKKNMLEIYIHDSSIDSWAYIGTLPFHDQGNNFAAANISPVEILVVVGSSVYKGTPMLFLIFFLQFF